ncbi:DJ-1/PfpI family protein [Granulicoccus sp. GXG6511]|uniref:DJ-1/PfpI family protein n=1 Tax=Granulicoccus sp. GXG6511 TaxID=3381351 RepID=UPI003D7CF04A
MTNPTKQVAFLVAHEGIEEIELTSPWAAVKEAGWTPVLLSPKSGEVQAFNHLDKSNTYPVDVEVKAASTEDFAALVLPGGVVDGNLITSRNPDDLEAFNGALLEALHHGSAA